jgi:hypothetical protein
MGNAVMKYKPEVVEIAEMLRSGTYDQSRRLISHCLNDPGMGDPEWAYLGLADRFIMLAVILRRYDANHPWLYERCREVEADPDGCIDLWAREHYKSTIITFAGIIQEIARNPEITIGIFSHTKGIAKGFLFQLKQELELNNSLPALYPDVFWENPKRDAASWSLDTGLVCKRKNNPKEKTVEAWGLVDGQPTSKHFELMVYDDVVTIESVSTADMIIKTTLAWEMSRNLAARTQDGTPSRTWHIGTRYNFADTYRVILDRGVVKPRIHTATDDGTPDGKPVFLTQEQWDHKKKESSAYTIACQQLQNPLAGEEQEFKPEWLRRYEIRPETLNVAILVDPANSKKKGTSNSAFAVIGIDAARNKYLLDGACHKMALPEKWKLLKFFRNKWLRSPGIQIVKVGYEKYGMQADIEHYKEMMRIEKIAFEIHEVSWTRDDTTSKDDRIRRLVPDHQNWRWFYPYDGDLTSTQQKAIDKGKAHLLAKPIRLKDHTGRVYDLVKWFIANEYMFFPATTAKDFMDAMSRFYDLDMSPPQIIHDSMLNPEPEGDY